MGFGRHSICEGCWAQREGDRVPIRIIEQFRSLETCCYCGEQNQDGIYIRADGSQLKCEGVHNRCRIEVGIFGRWIIVNERDFAWSGSQWVPYHHGIPTGEIQVCNFATKAEASDYATQAGIVIAMTPEEHLLGRELLPSFEAIAQTIVQLKASELAAKADLAELRSNLIWWIVGAVGLSASAQIVAGFLHH
jgi:hypothetical protein